MPWTSLVKDISTTSTTPHAPPSSAMTGRAPANLSISFTPAEFFGAGARCSHLHVVNPALVTPESVMVKSLVEQHVDDTHVDFAVLQSADTLKDFVKSYFAGTIASGLAYLAMINDGYVWSDHFENIGGGNATVTRTPDFVFARPGQSDVALMESKGTRRATSSAFDKTVEDGYTHQVEPHLGYAVGTSTATHGFSIGSWLTSTTKGELNIHHTDAVGAAGGGGTPSGSIAAVQQNNYATAFRLAHSEDLARQIRTGELENEIPFFLFEWLGRRWLTSDPTITQHTKTGGQYYEPLRDIDRKQRTFRYQPTFAVEQTCAAIVLKALSGYREPSDEFDLGPMSDSLRRAARDAGIAAAVFPDGLAVSYQNFRSVSESSVVLWNRKENSFVRV